MDALASVGEELVAGAAAGVAVPHSALLAAVPRPAHVELSTERLSCQALRRPSAARRVSNLRLFWCFRATGPRALDASPVVPPAAAIHQRAALEA